MIHFGKTQNDELQIIVNGGDIEAMRRIIMQAGLEERRNFYGLKQYIEDNFKEILTNKHQKQ